MQNTDWIILDTETTGFARPIFVVELAAQRMRGWEADGPPFRRMLNHGTTIPPQASRVHGYTREILERDGDAPLAVYQDFADYIGERPVTAYNLRYDWDDVLLPEWKRLSVLPAGTRGLCMMRLAQHLLDPVPAENCKLQTLRQYYNLPARGAHTALGDVETVIDLAQRVLRPLAEARGLTSWADLLAFAESEWFPARIAFGKFKGRLFFEARHDVDLLSWLEWLAASSNPRSAAMGRWYLAQLAASSDTVMAEAEISVAETSSETGLIIFTHPDVERFKALIENARNRLADLQAAYTAEQHSVRFIQAQLFGRLRPLFQARDLLQLRLSNRRKYLETLLSAGEDEAASVNREYEQAKSETDAEYERAAAQSREQGPLSLDDEAELKMLSRKLTSLYHPDRFMNDDIRQAAYAKLMAEINCAREAGNIARLREIANDPEGFMARQGWGFVAFDDNDSVDQLKHLYETLEGEIISILESIEALHGSNDFELYQLVSAQPEFLEQLVNEQSQEIEAENAALTAELARLEDEITELQT